MMQLAIENSNMKPVYYGPPTFFFPMKYSQLLMSVSISAFSPGAWSQQH